MGQARRRPSRRRGRPTGRRVQRRRTSLTAGAGTVAAVVAVGLVVLGAPATELAAQVTASWSPFRDAGMQSNQVPQVPRVPQVIEQSGIDVPEPPVDAPALTVPVPRDLDVQIVPPFVPHGVIPEYTPPPAPCGGYGSPRQMPPGVVPGVGSAALSWMADSNTAVRGYRVQAVSQQLVSGLQPAPPQQLVGQRGDCGEVTTTMSGLTSGVAYVFWLEEEVWDDDAQAVRYVHVGSSAPVVIG